MKSLIERLKAHIAELSASRFFDKHLRHIGSGEKENTAHSHPILLCYLAPKSSNVHLKEYNFQERAKRDKSACLCINGMTLRKTFHHKLIFAIALPDVTDSLMRQTGVKRRGGHVHCYDLPFCCLLP
jgi:hypothetical protein